MINRLSQESGWEAGSLVGFWGSHKANKPSGFPGIPGRTVYNGNGLSYTTSPISFSAFWVDLFLAFQNWLVKLIQDCMCFNDKHSNFTGIPFPAPGTDAQPGLWQESKSLRSGILPLIPDTHCVTSVCFFITKFKNFYCICVIVLSHFYPQG